MYQHQTAGLKWEAGAMWIILSPSQSHYPIQAPNSWAQKSNHYRESQCYRGSKAYRLVRLIIALKSIENNIAQPSFFYYHILKFREAELSNKWKIQYYRNPAVIVSLGILAMNPQDAQGPTDQSRAHPKSYLIPRFFLIFRNTQEIKQSDRIEKSRKLVRRNSLFLLYF